MDLAYTLFLILYYCASIVLSIIVAKFVIFAVSGGGGGEEGGKLERRLKVEGLKSVRKTVEEEISGETVLVSEFKGEPEPVVADDDSFDDSISKGLGSSAEESLEFPGTEASEETCSADQLLLGVEASPILEKDVFFAVNEGLICASEISLDGRVGEEEVGCCPIEGFELQRSNSRSGLDELVVYDEMTECKEDDVVREVLGSCVLNQQDEVGFFGDGDQELLNVVLPSVRGEVSEEFSELDEGTKRSVPKHDDDIDLGLLGGENCVDGDQHKYHMILESVETTESKEGTQEGYDDDQDEETRSSASKEDVGGQNRVDDDQVLKDHMILESVETTDLKEEAYVDDQDEETRSSASKEDVAGENSVDDDQVHNHVMILESVQTTDSNEGTQEAYVDDHDEETRSSVLKEDVGGENHVDENQHKNHMILESVETDSKEGTVEAYVVDQDGEIGSLVPKEDVVTRDEKGRICDEEEEWEGIERNDLDRDFAKAANFVECGNKGQLNKLGSDVMMQFYGLQKVAMEGPCYGPPPMALKLFARAKWNAWQKLGSMNPEEAMENYINLLSEKVPGWMGPSVEGKISLEEGGACSSSYANLGTTTLPLTFRDKSRPGEEPVMGAGDLTGNSSSVNTGVE